MYYISKSMELIGMLIIGGSFISNFPETINYYYLIVGIAFFSIGFLIEKFVLKQ